MREELVSLLVDMLNRGVHPVIPHKGSVGSSGDLVPLAHMAQVLVGEGRAVVGGKTLSGSEALREAGLSPIELKAKEGLALINGTQYMVAFGALGLRRVDRLLKIAQIALAMSLEALKGTDTPFDPRLSTARPHPGQRAVSDNLRLLLENSEIIASHEGCPKVQDPYTLRCAPQVLGAVMDAVSHCREVMQREINSATDNPLLFEDGSVISGGNFHGEPVALVLDYLGLAVSEMGSFSERRTARLVDGKLSGLPEFLTVAQGLDSGMMIPQYVAASLTSENKLLASPASADSLPTSANQEDFNSMGSVSAQKLDRMICNLEHILSIEILCAAQAVEFYQLEPGVGTRRALEFIRRGVERLTDDRSLSPDIEWICERIENDELLDWMEREVPLETL